MFFTVFFKHRLHPFYSVCCFHIQKVVEMSYNTKQVLVQFISRMSLCLRAETVPCPFSTVFG